MAGHRAIVDTRRSRRLERFQRGPDPPRDGKAKPLVGLGVLVVAQPFNGDVRGPRHVLATDAEREAAALSPRGSRSRGSGGKVMCSPQR